MSVKEKQREIDETRRAFEETGDEYAAYAEAFAADVADLQDSSGFHADRDALRAEIDDTKARFTTYTETFAADVADLRDVSGFRAAVDTLRADMEASGDQFAVFAEQFGVDVAEIRDSSDLSAAIAELGREFELTADAFGEYTEVFGAGVDEFQADTTDRREMFLAYREQYAEDVTEMLDEVATVEADAAALARAFVTARSVFDTYTREFYGATASGEPAEDSQPTADETPDSTDHEREDGDTEIEISLDDDPEGSVSDETDHDTKTRDPSPAPGSVVNDDTPDADETPDDVVQCLVCEEYYQAITEPHLQTHGMTIAEYRDEHGEDVPLRPDDKR